MKRKMYEKTKSILSLLMSVIIIITSINIPININAASIDDLMSSNVLELSFDDNLNDTSLEANTITVVGNETYAQGINGSALSLDGSTYLECGTNEALQPENLTVSFWINPTQAIAGENIIMWNKPNGGWDGNGWYLSSLNNDRPLVLSVGAAGNLEEFYITANRETFFPANTWTNVVVTFNTQDNTANIYRNGIAQTVYKGNNATNPDIVGNNTDTKYLGCNSPNYGAGGKMTALIDEFNIFSQVATPEDALYLFERYGEVNPQTIVDADYDNLTFPITSIKNNLTLQTMGSEGSSISWATSNDEYITNEGVVTRPTSQIGDVTVTLTATIEFSGIERTKEFEFVVEAMSGLTDAKELELKFEDNVSDTSDNAFAPALTGSASYIDGISGKALSLDGSSYVNCGNSPLLQPANLTLSFWVKTTQALAGENMLVWNKPNGAFNGNGYYLSSLDAATPLKISVGPASGVPLEAYVSGSREEFFPVGEWVHVAVSYESSSKICKIYRNGISQAVSYINQSENGAITATNDTKYIGFNSPSYGGGYAKLAIDEFNIYSEVATSNDVRELYGLYAEVDYEKLLQDDYDSLNIATKDVTNNIKLPVIGTKGESTISWESSDESVISTEGVVTRPAAAEGDAQVTMTATLTNGTFNKTKTFVVNVLAMSDLLGMQDFSLIDVTLLDEYEINAFNKDVEYLLSLDTNRLLAGFRQTAGLSMQGVTRYEGWENSLIGGHTIGHYLTAISQAYASLDETSEYKQDLLIKINEVVNGLKACQDAIGTGYLFGATLIDASNIELQFDNVELNRTNIGTQAWVPWYTMHKILDGVIKAYELTGNQVALLVAQDLGDWVYDRANSWSENTQKTVLNIEYGGMNDALYDLYKITNNQNHAIAAHKFDETTLFEKIMTRNDNVLNGLHANTTIPKFLGALNRYRAVGEEEYLEYAEVFWDMVIKNHTYITGGNSEWEHFGADNILDAERTNCNCETCNSYNMLKLSRELFKISGDKKYLDYYETTIINSILSSQNPLTGMTTYFQPMATGYFKVYGTPNDKFWCCTGSGMENFTKLQDSIYFKKDTTLFVNQYMSSKVKFDEANVEITQNSNVYSTDSDNLVTDKATFSIDVITGTTAEFELRLRLPDWLAAPAVVKINNTEVSYTIKSGFAVINRNWSDGDLLNINLPQEIKAYTLPDSSNAYGFKYGPLVLSAQLGTENMNVSTTGVVVSIPSSKIVSSEYIVVNGTVDDFVADINNNFKKSETVMTFDLKNTNQELVFTPHYKQHTQRYGIYWYLVDSSDATNSILSDKQARREAAALLDTVQPGYGQYENDELHQMQEENSVGATGEGTSRYAAAGGYFSYNMIINPLKSNYLELTFNAADVGKPIRILIGTTVIFDEILEYDGEEELFKINVPIPEDLIEDMLALPVSASTKSDATVISKVTASNELTTLRVRFEGTQTQDSARLMNFIYMKTEFDTDPSIAEISSNVGSFEIQNDEIKLTVPKNSTSVDLEFILANEYGLLYINGELVDDRLAQNIILSKDITQVELLSKAEDHETSITYNLTIVKSADSTIDGDTLDPNEDSNNDIDNDGNGLDLDADKVETGDNTPIILILVTMLVAAIIFIYAKKKNKLKIV